MSAPLLVLVGPPASGKTTVGTGVAEILGVAFRDTDADVEAVAGTTVADVFVQHGERYFRELEEQAVARALAEHEGVLALGGGAVTSAATRELLVAHGRREEADFRRHSRPVAPVRKEPSEERFGFPGPVHGRCVEMCDALLRGCLEERRDPSSTEPPETAGPEAEPR